LHLSSQTWDETQFIQADKQGRVFVLRGSPVLEVFALEGGELKSKGRLEGPTVGRDDGGAVSLASLSAAGDVWVLFTGPTTLETFEGVKRAQTIESTWKISDLAAGSGEPIASVIPVELNTPSPESPTLLRPPQIRRWDGKRWETTIEGDYSDEEAPGAVSWNLRFSAVYSSLLALTPERHLWVANQYAARLRHYSPSGVLKGELVLGSGKVAWSESKPADREALQLRLDAALKKSGFSATMSAPGTVPRATYRAITVGLDGYVYLVAETENGLALDRFQPNLPSYERLLLSDCEIGPGRPSLAAGRHELVLGARQGKGGSWEIPYEMLDGAKWKPVPGAVLDGAVIERAEDPLPVGTP